MRQSQKPVFNRLLGGILSNRKFWRDAGGLFIIALGIITLITLLGWNAGGIVSAWVDLLRHAFGVGTFVFCIVLIFIGVPMVLNTPVQFNADRLIQIIA